MRGVALARISAHAGITHKGVINDMQQADTVLQGRAATPIAKLVTDMR
jgi:hypothetical protein